MGYNHFRTILDRIHMVFPELDEGAVRHAANSVTNEIRSSHCDVWDVEFTRDPQYESGPYITFSVSASQVQIWVRLNVD